MAISTERGERFAAYAASHVWLEQPVLGAFVLAPQDLGVTSGRFLGRPGDVVHVITAHNPGQLLAADENQARHARLADDVAKLGNVTVWRAVGGDPQWQHTEECLAIIGLSDHEASALAGRFGQEAIFAWDERALRLLECGSSDETELGWSVERWEGEGPP